MKQAIKKRKQKISKKWERFSRQFKEDSREHIQENLIDRLASARKVRLLILEWCLLIIVVISLALTQAFWYRQSYSVQAFVDGGTYIEGTLGKVSSLNPLFASTSSEKALAKLMFATVSTIDYSGHVGLGLASSIVPNETGDVWTVVLKEGLKWSDGEPITIDDVIYTFNLAKDPAASTSYASTFAGVDVAKQENTAVFTLSSPYADFDSTLNFPVLPVHILGEVAPSEVIEHNFSSNPVTSGAFVFNAAQSASTSGDKIIYLAANNNYYQERPMLDSFAIHTYADTASIVEALSTGEITATAELAATDDVSAFSDIIYKKQTTVSSGVFAFLNTASPLLSDLGLRQAIQRGVDLETVRSVLIGEEALNYPILRSEIELNSYPEIPAYDPAVAQDAVKAAGAEGAGLRLATINTGYFPDIAHEFQEQLEKLGFKVELSIYDPGQEFLVNTLRPRNYDILIYGIELGADPDLFPYYHSSQASTSGLNFSNYRNSLVDQWILGARESMDQKIRVSRYENFLKKWVEDVPAIGIYQASLIYYFNKNVRTFSEDNRLVYATDRFGDVEYWAVDRTTKNRTP